MNEKKFVRPLIFEDDLSGEIETPIRSEMISPLVFLGKRSPGQENAEIRCPIRFLDKQQRESADISASEIDCDSKEEAVLQNLPMANILQESANVVKVAMDQPTVSAQLVSALSNFVIRPLKRITVLNGAGKLVPEEGRILCELQILGIKRADLEIRIRDISSIGKIITSRFAEARIDFGEPNAAKMIEDELRKQVLGIPEEFHLQGAGWHILHGIRVYVHKTALLPPNFVADTALDLPWDNRISRQEAGMIFLAALGITPNNPVMRIILPFSLMGVLYSPFCEAGFVPRFSLFINGRTGTLKTSLAKVFFTQLAKAEDRETPRRIDLDTEAALERGLVKSGRDTVLLIDDFAPAKTAQKGNALRNNLESVLRMVGDGATRSRSNARLDDIKGEGVHGMVAITGELKGTGTSSNLRCLYCTIHKGDVDASKLSEFQQNPDIFTTSIYHFAQFLAANWADIVSSIRTAFPQKRRTYAAQIRERRLLDTAICLSIAAEILGRFLTSVCGIASMTVSEEIHQMSDAILECVFSNEAMVHSGDYCTLFLRAVHHLWTNHVIHFAEGKPSLDDLERVDGYIEKSYIFLIFDNVFGKVDTHMRQNRQYLPFSSRDMASLLAEEDISVRTTNGRGKRVNFARIDVGDKVKHNFVKIPIAKFYDIVGMEE